MSFLDELKKRNVVRVGIFYLIAAWLIAQVGDLVLENFDAPDWMIRSLLITLAVGFPIALILAWVFEFTPEGIKKEEEVDRSLPHHKARKKRFDRIIIALLVIALGYFVWESRFSDETGTVSASAETSSQANSAALPEPVEKSIAVLPFENFSDSESDGFFADGLADTLLHKLAQIHDLKVIARNSSFQFKGSNRDVREIGEILGVTTVLEGSVQRAGDNIRVIAQLINTADGVHIWSQSFDDQMDNIFELQDRIAAEIVQKLDVNLSESERDALARNGTSSTEAYELLMLAEKASRDVTTDDLAELDDETYLPIQLLNRVLEIDPEYAQAWSSLSHQYNGLAFQAVSREDFRAYTQKARHAAQMAIDLDPEYYDGYLAMGFAHWRVGEINEAKVSYRKALELNPNSAGAMAGLGLALFQTDPAQSFQLFNRSAELHPNQQMIYRQQSFALKSLGQMEQAIEKLKEGIEHFPEEGVYFSDLAETYARDYGRPDLAAEWLSRFMNSFGVNLNGGLEMAVYWAWVQDSGRANAWLDRVERDFGVSDASRETRTRILLASNDFPALNTVMKQILESLSDGSEKSGQIRIIEAVICLHDRDYECALQNMILIKTRLDQLRGNGVTLPNAQSNATLMEGAALRGLGRVQEADELLTTLRDTVSQWPLLASDFASPEKKYRVSELESMLGHTSAAMTALEETLSLDDGGIIAFTSTGQSPEHSLFLASLKAEPEFEDWLNRFMERRDVIYQRMLDMEQSGNIVTPDVKDPTVTGTP